MVLVAILKQNSRLLGHFLKLVFLDRVVHCLHQLMIGPKQRPKLASNVDFAKVDLSHLILWIHFQMAHHELSTRRENYLFFLKLWEHLYVSSRMWKDVKISVDCWHVGRFLERPTSLERLGCDKAILLYDISNFVPLTELLVFVWLEIFRPYALTRPRRQFSKSFRCPFIYQVYFISTPVSIVRCLCSR